MEKNVFQAEMINIVAFTFKDDIESSYFLRWFYALQPNILHTFYELIIIMQDFIR